MKICIDPGHSGPCEPGACAGGVTEADINLQVAKIAARILASRGHEVKLTREKDIDNDDLLWRAEVAWQFRADIFISLHCNAAASPAAHGTEVFYYPTSQGGHALARCLQAALVRNCQTEDRGVKTNDEWTVLLETACPAVLVEMAFISNDQDRELLTDRFRQRQIAVGIANGVEDFAKGGPLFAGVMEHGVVYGFRRAARKI